MFLSNLWIENKIDFSKKKYFKLCLTIVNQIISIEKWWKHNFPNRELKSVALLSGGQSNLCYLINKELVLKIYQPKYEYAVGNQEAHFAAGSQFQPSLNSSGFTPEVIGVYPEDELLQANAMLMEYIEGDDLSKVLAYSSDKSTQYSTGKKIGEMLRALHRTKTIPNQEYNTRKSVDLVKNRLSRVIQKGFIPTRIQNLSEQFISIYKSKVIVDDFVLVHGDAHLENFIKQDSKLFIIDFDACSMGLNFFELRILLHLAFMPANLVAEELEIYYPNSSMLTLLKGIIDSYPKIMPLKYLPEIKLIALAEILQRFNLDESSKNKLTQIERAGQMFEQIFIKSSLENIQSI